MIKPFNFLLLLFLLSGSATIQAQQKPAFWTAIQKFKQQDSVNMPAKNGIVFVGSSSFTNWKDLETVFKEYNAINRGFGGSTLAQANFYIKDVVFPYEPRQVVIYSGENDIATDEVSAIETLDRFATFFTHIRNKFPEVAILYVSMKNSPSRTKYAETINHANQLIKDYLSSYSRTAFVDVNGKMMIKNQLRPELFLEDMLHMRPAGYQIWIKEIKPYLLK